MRNYEKEKQETKSKILHAFWEIYQTTRIEKITVKQITEACGIYRTTFYLHYSDVYAILENLEKELLDELMKWKEETKIQTAQEKHKLLLLYEMFQNRKDYLQVLVLGQQSTFALCYRIELAEALCSVYTLPADVVHHPLHAAMLQALAEVFLLWSSQENLSFEEIYTGLDDYLKRGILATILQK